MHFVIYLLAKMQIKSNSPAILEAVVCVDGNFFSEKNNNNPKTKQKPLQPSNNSNPIL